MKALPFSPPSILLLATFCLLAVAPSPSSAADLTPEQIASLRAKLEEMQATLEGKASERNRSAWSIFMTAAQSDKAAADLYENCTRIVDFEREGRTDAEFRDWQSNQRDRYKDEQFMEGMRLQLRWLAITCKAAEAEKFETVLPEVLGYLDSLTQLTEMPGGAALSPVTGSIFVRAYEIERLLGANGRWESVPFDIEGIYEKIILPYLRTDSPSQLMTAWEKRIAQQTHLVHFLEAKKAEQVKGDRDEKRQILERQQRQTGGGGGGGVLKTHDEDDFIRDTLPSLKWARMVDMYQYIDKLSAAQEMLVFLNENIAHKKAIDWLAKFQSLIGDAASPGFNNGEGDTTNEPAPAPAPTATEAPTSTTPSTPPTNTTTAGEGGLKFD